MSFVASFAYAAPVCSVASPESFAAASSAVAALASASRNVYAFFGLRERVVERRLGDADARRAAAFACGGS